MRARRRLHWRACLTPWPPLAAAVALLLSPSPASTQGGIAVQEAMAASRFPEGVLFSLAASGPLPITSVTVRYQVLGERAARYQRAAFAAATSVKTEVLVRADTADRYIPPGAEIEYWFEVEDQGGARAETAPARLVLLDPRFQWERLDAPGGYILYYGGAGERARAVLAAAQETVERMGRLLGVTPQGPVRLTLYNSWAQMRVALPPRSQVQEQALVTEGVSFGDTGVLLVLGSAPRVRGVTSHETVHFLVREAMGGMAWVVPAWLNEGLAEYGNVEPGTTYDLALATGIREGRLLPLTSLTSPPGAPDDVILFYGQARSVVRFMVDGFGAVPLQALLAALRGGEPLDQALIRAYGFDRAGLDTLWREAAGAPPLEEHALQGGLPTPAARPTLAPFGAEAPSPGLSPTPAATATPSPGSTPPLAGGFCTRGPGEPPVELAQAGLLLLGLLSRRRSRPPGAGPRVATAESFGKGRWGTISRGKRSPSPLRKNPRS